MTRRLALRVACIAALLTAGVPAIKWLDIHLAGEVLRDAVGRWRYHEDWAAIPTLGTGLDYRWLPQATLVAHALGGADGPLQNSYRAMDSSLALGLRVLEMDLWLDQQGQLRCHHGPAEPAARTPGECDWQTLVQKTQRAHAWLVIDIKTDFARTAQAALRALPSRDAAEHIVFQLYKPEHVRLFSGWLATYPLAGPIVTAYTANRSLDHIAEHVARSGVLALTVPLYRRAALHALAPATHLFVHPVHDCDDAQQASPVYGLYVSVTVAQQLHNTCK